MPESFCPDVMPQAHIFYFTTCFHVNDNTTVFHLPVINVGCLNPEGEFC